MSFGTTSCVANGLPQSHSCALVVPALRYPHPPLSRSGRTAAGAWPGPSCSTAKRARSQKPRRMTKPALARQLQRQRERLLPLHLGRQTAPLRARQHLASGAPMPRPRRRSRRGRPLRRPQRQPAWRRCKIWPNSPQPRRPLRRSLPAPWQSAHRTHRSRARPLSRVYLGQALCQARQLQSPLPQPQTLSPS